MTNPWMSEYGGVPEYNPADAPKCRINISASSTVEISKIYGPWAVLPIRISLDYDKGQWVSPSAIIASSGVATTATWPPQDRCHFH